MLAGSGRPRKACDQCKRQKVRCSLDRPSCTRCARLGHTCAYAAAAADSFHTITNSRFDNPAPPVSPAVTSARSPGQPQREQHLGYLDTPDSLSRAIPRPISPEKTLLGIPSSLIASLVQVYYSHVYNASLLLHRASFTQQLKSGTASPALVLSVCAFASIFYRDSKDNSSLREHGFSVEWAERAGKLAFQDVESPNKNHIVIFVNLLLFWYGQGSWRRSIVHKANAFQIAHILGLGRERRGKESLFESEVDRRRFWACYLVNCHASDSIFGMYSMKAIGGLSLPWKDKDFKACHLSQPLVSMSSGKTNGGLWCETIRAMTIWITVYDLIKSPNPEIVAHVTAIHSLDARITEWWAQVPNELKISDLDETVDLEAIPRLILIKAAYHQSLCALHASIVPLFSWSSNEGDENWGLAIQLSAQVAFEHACKASALFELILDSRDPSAAPSFVAYAAYCGCAIQIPFLWSSDLQLQQRIRANIRTNIRLIQTIGNYWRFGALLAIHVQYLYRMHAKNPIPLEAEPKYLNPSTLKGFRVTSLHVRESILGHNGILFARGEGCVEQGDEVIDLESEQGNIVHNSRSRTTTTAVTVPRAITDPNPGGLWSPLQTELSETDGPHLSQILESNNASNGNPVTQNLDFFNPFLDPDKYNMFPDGEMLDFNLNNSAGLDLDSFIG